MAGTDKVSVDDLVAAARWLDVNEGDGGEAEACKRVAAMLKAEIERREQDALVRRVAREEGVPLALARKAVALAREQGA